MKIRENMLPVLAPQGGEEEINALRDVIESGWWGKGPKVAEFEEKFAEMVGHKYAVAVTSVPFKRKRYVSIPKMLKDIKNLIPRF
jgi:perosamine synthetase